MGAGVRAQRPPVRLEDPARSEEPARLERLRQLGGRMEVLPLEIPASASSRIRERPDPAQVPPELWPALLQHNLYGLRRP